jgi:hypothetical protein
MMIMRLHTGIILCLCLAVVGINNIYADPYVEYNDSFDTSQNFTITYKYVPDISSDELPEYIKSLNESKAWVFHFTQSDNGSSEWGKRFEVGYWVDSDNNQSTYIIKMGDINGRTYSIRLPDLEMEKGKEYYFSIVKNGTDFKIYVNGELYNGTSILVTSPPWTKIGTFNNGSITLPENFTITNGTDDLNFNTSYHAGEMPRSDYGIIVSPYAKPVEKLNEDINTLRGSGGAPIRAPIPCGAIIMSMILITLLRNSKWIKKC